MIPVGLLAKLAEWRRGLSTAAWWTLAAVLVVAVLVIWGALTWGAHQKAQAVQAQAGATLAGARSQSAGEAINTIDHNVQGGAAIDAQVKGSTDALDRAPVADRDAVALRELCGFKSARNSPDCRLLKPGP